MTDSVMRGGSGISIPRDANRVPALYGVSSADGTTPIPIEVDPATGRILIGTNPWSAYFANAITSTVTVSSAKGAFGGYFLINLNSSPAYLQVFDTTGAVSLGSTAPTFVLPIPANSTAANGLAANLELADGVKISNGIKVAATTTPNGGSAVSTGLSGSIWYL